MVDRYLYENVLKALNQMPAVALLGPRQCGKSTLARMVVEAHFKTRAVFLDLERPSDIARLADPELFLKRHEDKLVCLDEIQRMPALFSVLRSLIDEKRIPGRFLVLGSASRDLIRQSSESLAGRIRYLELTPFLQIESHGAAYEALWMRGGYPESLLAIDDTASFEWRLDFIRSFLERDVPALSPRTNTSTIRRLWSMLAHVHGQVLNMAKLANSLDVANQTVTHYIDLLEGAFMARRLMPFSANTGKRLTKSPKVYLRDSGVLHGLLGVRSFDELLGHPCCGASWEGFCIENILASCHREVEPYFYRTSGGAELDLVLVRGRQRIAIEFKTSSAPAVRRGYWSAVQDLNSQRNWIVAQVQDTYPLKNATVSSLQGFLKAPENADFLNIVSC